MGTYMIPRNTKGEGRILYIFSTKALIYTVGSVIAGLPFYYLFNLIKFPIGEKVITLKIIGIIIIILFGLIGYLVGTIRVPDTDAFKLTRIVGGEKIDDIIIRYIKFKRKKNKIYITKEEDI